MRAFVSMAGVAVLLTAGVLLPTAARAQSEGDLRLVGGGSVNEGRVEVFHDGQWGTVCDDIWTSEGGEEHPQNAEVVCRQLGFGPPIRATCCAEFGQGSGPIWMDDVNCSGHESRLVDCPFNGFGDNNCGHSEDAGVICSFAAGTPAMSSTTLMLAALGLIASGAFVLRRRKQTV